MLHVHYIQGLVQYIGGKNGTAPLQRGCSVLYCTARLYPCIGLLLIIIVVVLLLLIIVVLLLLLIIIIVVLLLLIIVVVLLLLIMIMKVRNNGRSSGNNGRSCTVGRPRVVRSMCRTQLCCAGPCRVYTWLGSNSTPTWLSRCCFTACHFSFGKSLGRNAIRIEPDEKRT